MSDLAETYETTGPRCPYCGHLHRPEAEAIFYDESACELECEHCEKTFRMSVYVSHSWTCRPLDCDAA